jgi:hypothetical protein
MNSAIENLNELSQYTATGSIPADLLTWLNQCLTRWQDGVSLHEAFGVCDSVKERIQRRNQQLNDYAMLLDGSKWHKAEVISREVGLIRQNRRSASPILKSVDSICPIPETPRQLFNILKQ